MKRLKRFILLCSGILFCAALGLIVGILRDTMHSRAGQALLWSSGKLVIPMLSNLPWYGWAVSLVVISWLWWRHKLVMSLILGGLIGIWVATI